MDIAKILSEKWKGAIWDLNGDSYEGLVWKDKTIPKPTLQEIEFFSDEITKQQLKSEMKAEAIRIAQERVLDAEIAKDPYLSAMADVEAKIDSGEINENARQAIRYRV